VITVDVISPKGWVGLRVSPPPSIFLLKASPFVFCNGRGASATYCDQIS